MLSSFRFVLENDFHVGGIVDLADAYGPLTASLLHVGYLMLGNSAFHSLFSLKIKKMDGYMQTLTGKAP